MFRSYSSADYELIRIGISSDEKANPGELVCKVPIPSLVAGPLLAEDFGFKIQFNFNFQASWMQNNVQKDLFFKLQSKTTEGGLAAAWKINGAYLCLAQEGRHFGPRTFAYLAV